MAIATPNLNRRLARWRRRIALVSLVESVLCVAVGATAAALAMLTWRCLASAPPPGIRAMIGLAPLALLAGAAIVRRGAHPFGMAAKRTGSRSAWWFSFVAATGWLVGWVALPAALDGGDMRGTAAAVLVLNSLAFAVLRIIGLRRRLAPWLDERGRLHLLLTTAGELARVDRPLNDLERAVIARAESRAADAATFRGISARRLGGRWWGLLAVLIAGAALTGWLEQTRVSPPPAAAGGQARAAQSAVGGPAGRLAQVAAVIRSADPATANQVESADSPEQAAEAIRRRQTQLAAQVAAAQPLLEALSTLAGESVGQPIAAALADPAQTPEQVRRGVAAQAESLRAAGMTAADRGRLADQLRRAADRVAAADPELANRLKAAADALAAGDWQKLIDQMAAAVERIAPVALEQRLAAASARRLADALAELGAAPAVATAPPSEPAGPPAGLEVRWPQARSRAADQLRTLQLDDAQQRLVRRYFDLPAEQETSTPQ